MFDRLVESTGRKEGGRTGRVFVATGLLYGIGMLGMGVGAILSFSRVLGEEYSLYARLAPPPPPGPPAVPLAQARAEPVQTQFAPPTKPPIEILPAEAAAAIRPIVARQPFVDGAPIGAGGGLIGGVIGGREGGDPPPRPPIVEKKEAEPPPVVETRPRAPQRISEGVLAGKALHREKPVYPAIARAARAGGPVAVQVTISEEGRVIDVVALSGHPMLRAAALAAARQWVFTPTLLSNVPVKVQGILTFNFTLQ